jgi:hypothetical protein
MKTQINSKALLVTTFLLFTLISSTWAEKTESVQVSVMPGKKVLIHANNPQKHPFSIEITNSETSFKVHTSELSGNSIYRQVFNLSKLPVGNYTIAIIFENKVFEKEIQINDYMCIVLEEKVFNLPDFEIQDKNLLITYLDSKTEKVNVSFMHGDEVFFKDESVNWPVTKRNYNLAKLVPGDYQVLLSTGDKSYSYNFDVK